MFNFQDRLIPNSAWKDYSANTNYAFDAFNENDHQTKQPTAKPRGGGGGRSNGASQQTTLQMKDTPVKSSYYEPNRNGRSHQNGGDHR